MNASPENQARIRTPDQRLRIFVSSTLKELAPERQASRAAIERLRLAPVMFELGARPHPPRQLYRAYLQQSDVFVGLYWERYGWVAPGEGVSGLEDEYNLAGDLPKLIYIKESVGTRDTRLQELLDRIRDDDSASFKYFSTTRELKKLLESDLVTLLAERFDQSHARPAASAPFAGTAQELPAPLTGLIGRDREVQEAEALLERAPVRLVTITGPGGIGKTRLAIAVANRFRDGTGHEVAFVDLSPLDDPARVPNAIAEGLGVNDTGDEPLNDKLVSALRGRRILIVLDNFEVVLDATPTVTALLATLPSLKFLVTSRTRLHASSEYIFDVGPLALPPTESPEGETVAPAALLNVPSIALFAERARAVKPDFELTAENADAVAAICVALDGVPLALELASARLRILAPRTLLARLDRRLPLLDGGPSDRPARQQTLRRTIEWSTQQLGEDEGTVLAELGVFSGLFTLDAAEAVSQDSINSDLLSCLDTLVDSSLIREHDRGGESTFSMLSTVREYAIERLESNGSLTATRERHARYYIEWAEEIERELFGPRHYELIDRANDDRDNFRAAIRFLLDTRNWDAGAGLAWSLRMYCFISGLQGEVRDWMEQVLTDEENLSDRTHAIALTGMWGLMLFKGVNEQAISALSECLDLFRAAGDAVGEAQSRIFLSTALMSRENPDTAQIADNVTTALLVSREADDGWGQVFALVALGSTALMERDVPRALGRYEEALDVIQRRDAEGFGMAYAMGHLAWAKLAAGDLEGAHRAFSETIAVSGKLRHAISVASTLDGLAAVAAATADYERAGRLLGASETMWKRAGQYNARQISLSLAFLAPMLSSEGMAHVEPARAEGARMSMDEAISYALADHAPPLRQATAH
ncbi:DUF4062 domain-containing protein [Mycetocola sp. 2940]|uniref:ATP-binding protein n=1 Tax=Mycetocola sp. 2940 TaxID=3156452 RepID=UPI003399F661